MRASVDPSRSLLRSRPLLLAAALIPATVFADDFLVAPTDLEFGATFVGETSSISVVIINISGVTQTPNFAGGAPFDQDNFGGSQNCAGATFPPGASCEFTYEFHPVSTGPKSSSTTIGIDDADYTITMAGTGLFPIAVGPLVLDFGDVNVGDTATRSVTFMNISSVPQTPNYAGGAPNDPENFGGSQNCAGVTLPPGGSCQFTYEFHPVSSGPKITTTGIGVDDQDFTLTLFGNGTGDVIFGNGFD
jgi:hypothetical protein